MGELFKHFEGWDVQALRKETEEAKKETEKAKKETEEKKKEVEEAKKQIAQTRESGIQILINSIKELHATSDVATAQLMEKYKLSAEEATEKVNLYW